MLSSTCTVAIPAQHIRRLLQPAGCHNSFWYSGLSVPAQCPALSPSMPCFQFCPHLFPSINSPFPSLFLEPIASYCLEPGVRSPQVTLASPPLIFQKTYGSPNLNWCSALLPSPLCGLTWHHTPPYTLSSGQTRLPYVAVCGVGGGGPALVLSLCLGAGHLVPGLLTERQLWVCFHVSASSETAMTLCGNVPVRL